MTIPWKVMFFIDNQIFLLLSKAKIAMKAVISFKNKIQSKNKKSHEGY
jgi:hypothetical protein